MAIQALPSVLVLIFVWFIPESPRESLATAIESQLIIR